MNFSKPSPPPRRVGRFQQPLQIGGVRFRSSNPFFKNRSDRPYSICSSCVGALAIKDIPFAAALGACRYASVSHNSQFNSKSGAGNKGSSFATNLATVASSGRPNRFNTISMVQNQRQPLLMVEHVQSTLNNASSNFACIAVSTGVTQRCESADKPP